MPKQHGLLYNVFNTTTGKWSSTAKTTPITDTVEFFDLGTDGNLLYVMQTADEKCNGWRLHVVLNTVRVDELKNGTVITGDNTLKSVHIRPGSNSYWQGVASIGGEVYHTEVIVEMTDKGPISTDIFGEGEFVIRLYPEFEEVLVSKLDPLKKRSEYYFRSLIDGTIRRNELFTPPILPFRASKAFGVDNRYVLTSESNMNTDFGGKGKYTVSLIDQKLMSIVDVFHLSRRASELEVNEENSTFYILQYRPDELTKFQYSESGISFLNKIALKPLGFNADVMLETPTLRDGFLMGVTEKKELLMLELEALILSRLALPDGVIKNNDKFILDDKNLIVQRMDGTIYRYHISKDSAGKISVEAYK